MTEPASISIGIAARYASAIFDLARAENKLSALAGDLDALEAALSDSSGLRDLIHSPIYSRDEQTRAIVAVAEKMALSGLAVNALGLLASKRRLFVLPHLIDALRVMIAEEKGEITADVTAARALTQAQQNKLAASLKSSVGKDVKINMAVDENLIGGLIVKLGSKMIDTSIRSKLDALQNTMKEAG